MLQNTSRCSGKYKITETEETFGMMIFYLIPHQNDHGHALENMKCFCSIS
jgi:hypothetical protein